MSRTSIHTHEEAGGRLHVLQLLADNYAYILEWQGKCAVIDPGLSSPILQLAANHRLRVESVLVTHGHYDHIAGVAEIARAFSSRVFAPEGCRVESPAEALRDGDELGVGPFALRVLSTPGHTAHDISFLDPVRGLLFSGDILFTGGCGRPFECPPGVLWQSLTRLASLPDTTRVFCGHEYTVSNLQFALAQLGPHPAIEQRLQDCLRQRELGQPCVPSTLALEKQTNLFLMAGDPAVRAAIGMPDATAEEAFSELRDRKNRS